MTHEKVMPLIVWYKEVYWFQICAWNKEIPNIYAALSGRGLVYTHTHTQNTDCISHALLCMTTKKFKTNNMPKCSTLCTGKAV